MLDVIKKCINDSSVVSIYKYDEDSFNCGFLIKCDNDFCVLESYSPKGYDDGFLLLLNDDISKIEIDTKYNKKIEKYIEINNQQHSSFQSMESDLLNNIIKWSIEDNILLTVESNGNLISGYPKCLDEDICVIEQINEYGENDGDVYIRTCDISEVSLMSAGEKMLDSLHKEKLNVLKTKLKERLYVKNK